MTGELIRHAFVMPHWLYFSIMILFPLVFLVLAHRRAAADAALKEKDRITLTEDIEDDAKAMNWVPPGNRMTRIVDTICHHIGVFVSLWTVVCVFYYLFEVLSRYFLNLPTNWVHEGSYLMFGVMYTLGGSALYLADGHVRVDVFYAKWSRRQRAGSDIITSVVASIFILGMLVSGWLFFAQGLDQNILPAWLALGYNMDLSASEWQIAYWPVKFTISFGALLVGLMIISRFVKDLQTFRHFSEVDNAK